MSDLEAIKKAAAALSPWAHLATVGADGNPDVVPVHPAWEGDTLWFMTFDATVKAKNIGVNPSVALHWQVSEVGDGVEVWGHAEVHSDLDTKRRLWDGVFDYDLNLFSPGGPEDSPQTVFVSVTPQRALHLVGYGAGGMTRWAAGS